MPFVTLRRSFNTAVLVLLSGCGKQGEYVPPPPPVVEILDAVSIDIADEMTFTGTTRATATVDLRAKVSGYLEQINFKDGDSVEKFDPRGGSQKNTEASSRKPLFVIEQAPFERELDAKKAELQRAEAALNLAQANRARTDKLRNENASTQQQEDLAKAEVATAEADVAAAKAAVAQAQLNLDYTTIYAPMGGRIGRHLVDVGNLVQAGTMSLAVIEAVDPIDVYFYISEPDILELRNRIDQGQLPDPDVMPPTLKMGLLNDEGYPYEGTLNFRELGVDPNTGTILRRARFANPNQELIPGLFVRLKAELGKPTPRVLIEDIAVMTDQRGDAVFVVERRRKKDAKGELIEPAEYEYAANRRMVKLGRKYKDLRIVHSGIQAGEWVITRGIQKARDGAPVLFTREEIQKAAQERARRLEPETGQSSPAPLPEPIAAPAAAAPTAPSPAEQSETKSEAAGTPAADPKTPDPTEEASR